MGVQALNDIDLKRLGRLHTAKEAMQAFDIAHKNFERISFDLIYARQDQTLDSWVSELKFALTQAADHLSLYQLTIENGTRFGELYDLGNLKGLPDDNLAADMYATTQEICADAGLNAYEISNYAKEGAESRHNMIYWRYGDYIGIGPGAHGRITLDGKKQATITPSLPEAWLQRVQSNGHSLQLNEIISKPEQAEEYLMMSLRLSEGTSLSRFQSLYSAPMNQIKINALVEQKLLTCTNDTLIATKAGRMILNAILKELLT